MIVGLSDTAEAIGETIKYAFSWLRDSSAWKYYAILLLLQIVFGAVLFTVVIGVFLAAGIGAVLSSGLIASRALNASAIGSTANPITALLLPVLSVIAFVIVLIVVYAIANAFVSAKVLMHAMNSLGVRTPALTTYKFFRLILLNILVAITALFSLYSLRYAIVLIAAVILVAMGLFIAPGVQLLGFILLFFYAIIVVYNAIRLSAAPQAFLSKEIGKSAAIRESLDLTRGNALEVSLITLVVGIIAGAIAGIASAVPLIGALILFALLPGLQVTQVYSQAKIYGLLLKQK